MSDLHLESGSGYDTFMIEPRAPYLALLGDVGNTRDDKLYKFFETQLRRFQKVFFLLGNHDQKRYDINPNVTILGCTLFSHITSEQKETVSFGLWDFYDIAEWTVEDHTKARHSDLTWLQSQLTTLSKDDVKRHVFVMTHHSPTIAAEVCDPKHGNSNISSGFASDLVPGTRGLEGINVWAFGHTHFNCDFMMGSMRVCTNQRGYYFKVAEGFDGGMVVSI